MLSLLDKNGRPNHEKNFCESPLLCNTKVGTCEKQLLYQYIWHFSRFVERGARHLSSTRFSGDVEAAAFHNPDETSIAVLLNITASLRTVFIRIKESILHVPLEGGFICTVRQKKSGK